MATPVRLLGDRLWPSQTPARRAISAGQKWPASNETACLCSCNESVGVYDQIKNNNYNFPRHL